MKSSNASQSDNRHSDRLQRLDREIGEILTRIEQEEIPQKLMRLAEQLQAALKRKRDVSAEE
ncbi:hypothetical protein ACG873_26830 [Mesorhizobium sp. AaZ16]|uniref:hypothetical protein n=1 Tax=Mesorhizobium sp. AaZ16 TaxID=3402289 RepID=UPI00374F5972